MAAREYDHLFKVVLIGDSAVGKSCLLLRFADDTFTESFISTIGVDFRFRTLNIDGKLIKLQIWDTAGQERFRTITSAYYRGADGIMMVYDKTARKSFDNVDEWLSEVDKYSNENTVKILLGNKCDALENITTQEGEIKAKKLGLIHLDTSAKSADNVDLAFEILASEMIKLKKDEPAPQRAVIAPVRDPSKKEESSCCT